ncbi:MAG TPA: CHRD domain-containing protein [Gemmatimonadales bacterium]|nr:CHRD domain-containing protein [Gemmatimonadales bacterium]
MRAVHVCAVLAVAACTDQTPTNIASNTNRTPSFSVASEAAPPIVFNVELRAENEPGPLSDSESKGHAQVKVFEDGTIEFTFTINNKHGETYTRAHIHKAPAGVNGGIHWDFLEGGVPVASISDQPSQLRGVARARQGTAVLADLLANPAGYYVNVHSTDFPSGALRGQLE